MMPHVNKALTTLCHACESVVITVLLSGKEMVGSVWQSSCGSPSQTAGGKDPQSKLQCKRSLQPTPDLCRLFKGLFVLGLLGTVNRAPEV